MKNKLSIIISLLILTVGCIKNEQEKDKSGSEIQGKKMQVDTSGLSLNVIEFLHKRKTLKTYDRSLLDYINSSPNRPDSKRKVVYILPFGNMKPEVEEIIRNEVEYLEVFLQLPVRMLNRFSYEDIKDLDSVETRLVPDSDFGYYSKMKGEIENLREQIEASSFIDYYLTQNKPNDAIAVLGVTEHDIYKPKYNYLFGTSSLKNRVGLISTFRLIDYGEETKYNIRKVISKQIVNMFSIKNVKDYVCLLNFHNSILELQAGDFVLSTKALEKLKYNIGFDYNKRFKELKEFWEAEENDRMVDYYLKCIELTTKNERNSD
jgi:archaemetzincin